MERPPIRGEGALRRSAHVIHGALSLRTNLSIAYVRGAALLARDCLFISANVERVLSPLRS
jgi:hypothetical protein